MIPLPQRVGVEPLITEIARHADVLEVHVREETRWTWTRHIADPDDAGVRYGRTTTLSIVGGADPGTETVVATLILGDARDEGRGDLITHYELDDSQPYRLVRIAAAALR